MILIFLFYYSNSFNEKIIVDKSKLEEHVKALVDTKKTRNCLNIDILNNCATYIQEQFLAIGLKPNEQLFTVNDIEYKNIECRLGSNIKGKIVIGAHYDVYKNTVGADDNASGVSSLIELSRLLKKYENQLKYELILVAYSLEEPPYFNTEKMGSYFHAKSLIDNNEKINLMICLEMLGYYSEEKDSQDYPLDIMKLIYPQKGNFIAAVGKLNTFDKLLNIKKAINQNSNIKCEILPAPDFIDAIDYSDHINYQKFHIKSIMITDTALYRNPNYHELTDKINTLNFDKMSEVVKGLAYYILNNEL
ncbi:MAG: hypothetical protein A2086_10810 [Spirochaetes bacterium GWD1_27_9]|nr:MAG: hypothetical protein A2Z98_09885 [Spirochaetes bacterium GWB1_27_13]OHD28328.1 MAG: hypothetical protein A2Y34_09695 [Spirochaetes bacterium GWC1_27_15]OHD35065.1 MAG: hypothetical protein A2086_10810 [Spirochaetes bacterium GWD1_27_9]